MGRASTASSAHLLPLFAGCTVGVARLGPVRPALALSNRPHWRVRFTPQKRLLLFYGFRLAYLGNGFVDRVASGLARREGDVQVNTLIYAMGDQADDILISFTLSDEDRKSYATVKSKFDNHFIQRRNVIFERAKFNRRRQEENEPVEVFITALYSLAEHCGYGDLHDEMIRDRIVVGIRNSSLSEKLQPDAGLTLESLESADPLDPFLGTAERERFRHSDLERRGRRAISDGRRTRCVSWACPRGSSF